MVEDIPQTAARDVPSLLGSAVRDGPALAQGAAPALFTLLQDLSRVFNLVTQEASNAVRRTPDGLEKSSYRSSARATATRRAAAPLFAPAAPVPATHKSSECT